MSPNLARLIYLIFIVSILAIDIKEKSDVTPALWIPLLWMMNIISRPISYWLNPHPMVAKEIELLSGDAVNRTFLIILIICGLFILSRRRIRWSEVVKRNSWILGLCISSQTWHVFNVGKCCRRENCL